jgi:hypothetical protein
MSPQPTRHGERGQVTAFVVVLTAALLLLAGLALDGGLALAAKRQAINEAEQAARAGAQAIATGTYRQTGRLVLDPGRARAAARTYLAATGHPGSVQVSASGRVVVTVTITQPTQLLRLAGVTRITVTGRGAARPARAVEEATP